LRLLTRSDFDGLACAVLLKEVGIVDDRKFVHPKDIQDGLIQVTENDILANIPYVKGCGLWFDHHSSEKERIQMQGKFKGDSRPAPSAARVIYDYYGGKEKFGHLDELMLAVDKADSGQFTVDEILNPKGWVLLSFVMDPRTGLGRFHDFRIGNYQLMDDMINYCRTMTVEEILAISDVAERVERYWEQNELFKQMILENTHTEGNIIVSDMRNLEVIYSGNRFLIYSLYPEQNISIWIVDGRNKMNCVFAVGHSIVNRTCKTDVGSLLLKYGGGGHRVVGTCQVPYDQANTVLQELITVMKEA
jgi:oligoribonuclease NrnB/cAMP/cGMP phosphodiesterase (DHH superfamily)